MSYRTQPQHDLRVLDHKDPGHGPRGSRDNGATAAVLIDATLKGIYAPVALPKKEFMEGARTMWEDLGLPELRPQFPWHGYDLGHWPEALAKQAKRATDGDYFITGEEFALLRRNDVEMNSPVPDSSSPSVR
jgi:hypothetical protein